ncbi:hypothetical protein ILUMI_12368 [Ignelater luminosus]|uniref:Uncharacterized protein n=1 Tax=Ignelater luminosus TaxID=2038154 RepID=A0A8K0GBV2_IGNLU|nr:hypothetical protein ILUMI_12368 [Ignelater luminosus]
MEICKDCMHVSDANALKGLPMLLEGFAATWWQGVKATKTELFLSEEDSKTPTDIFVCQARAIISQLPPDTLLEVVPLIVEGENRDLRAF